MFDILGNVFGRSKKSNSSGASNGAKDDEITFLPESHTIYPSLILTDQMIKGGLNPGATPSTNPPHSASSASLSETVGSPAISGPHSSSDSRIASSSNAIAMNLMESSSARSTPRVTCPLDNVPFQLIPIASAKFGGSSIDLDEQIGKITSIGLWLHHDQAQYSFETERIVIAHSCNV